MMDQTFIGLFAKTASRRSDVVALVCEGECMSYAQLDVRSDAIANALRRAGINPGDTVPLLLERGNDAVAAMLGVLKAGAAVCVVSTEYPVERVEYIRRECSAAMILDKKWLDEIGLAEGEPPALAVDPKMPALVVFTSGSTGNPKGVVIPHHALSLAIAGDTLGRDENDVFLSIAAFSFIAVVIDILTPLAIGATVHIAGQGMRRDVSQIVQYVRTHGISTALMPPQTAAQFLRLADGVLSTLLTGTERVSRLYSDKTRIINVYGASETCGPVTSFPIDKSYDSTPLGRPYAGSAVFILNESGGKAATDEEGEICISGQIASGYLNSPEQTAESFIDNPFTAGSDDAKLYRTGDIGKMRPDGTLEYVQRKDWMLKVRGYRVEPGEIEAAMKRLAPIDQAVVIGFENAAGETSLYACYTAEQPVEPAMVAKAIGDFLPEYMVPSLMEQITAIPLNPNGKVDRKNIRPPDLQRRKAEYEEPEGDAERALTAAFSKVLGIPGIGALDDFLLLGGDSVSAVRLQVLLPDMGLSVSDILGSRTPRALATLSNDKDGTQKIAVSPDRNEWPLTFAERQMATEYGMDPESVAYNVNLAFTLTGELDVSRLEDALAELVRCNRILRSYYVEKDGEFLHVIADAVPVSLAREVCRPEDVAKRIAELNKPYRLDRAPLFRFVLFSIAEDKWILHLGMRASEVAVTASPR